MNVFIDIVSENSTVVLKAENGNFSEFPRIFIGFNHLNEIFYSKSVIEISYSKNPVSVIWNKIDNLLNANVNICVVLSDSAQLFFKNSEDEEEKFRIFSKKALDVRNNVIEKSELQDYLDILSKTDFKRTLMPYQLLASYHLAISQNECNFSVPGSGKTTTVLAAFEYLRKCASAQKHVDYLLVVGPLSSFISWKDEYFECFGKIPNTLEIRGGVKEETVRKQLISSTVDVDLILISYGSLVSKLETLKSFLSDKRTMVVLDEAHRIKNVGDGVQAKAAMSLAEYAKSRVVLTGTPAANSYVDLYNLFTFIWPTKNVIGYSVPALNNMAKNENDGRVSDLINKISPYFIRIKKSDLHLPDPVYNKPFEIEMGPIQQAIYDAIEKMAINKFENNGISQIFKKSAAIRLRQAASNPSMLKKPLKDLFTFEEESDEYNEVYDDEINVDNSIIDLINNYDELETPTRLINLLRFVKEKTDLNKKIIIWCEFIDTCDRVSEYLYKNGINNQILYGKTAQEDRESIIRAFKDTDNNDFMVVIANPHAVGESISLHKACHEAIYYEMGFNAGVYMQSKDRIHRVGLPENVVTSYYYFQSENSVEQSIYSRVMMKEQRMIDVIESQEIPLINSNIDFENNPDDDDIKTIIKDYYARRKDI